MKKFIVRSFENIKHGVVTSLRGRIGIVMFDDKSSAYFNAIDGAEIACDRANHQVTFVSGSIEPLTMQMPPVKRRIVAVLNDRNQDWVFIWGYENEYRQARNALALVQEENQRRENESIKFNQLLDSLGNFRIVKQHCFDEETEPRNPTILAGPMKFPLLLSCLEKGQVKFVRSQKHGKNDVVSQWIEKQVDRVWVKVEISDEEIDTLIENSVSNVAVNTIIDRLANVGIPERPIFVPTKAAPQSKLDRRQRTKVMPEVKLAEVSVDKAFNSLEEMVAANATA